MKNILNEKEPSRYRLYCHIIIDPLSFNLRLTDQNTITQKVQDFRSKERKLNLLKSEHINNKYFLEILYHSYYYIIYKIIKHQI